MTPQAGRVGAPRLGLAPSLAQHSRRHYLGRLWVSERAMNQVSAEASDARFSVS